MGCFVECVLDIVHEPKHFGLGIQILRKIILTVLPLLQEKQVDGDVQYSRVPLELPVGELDFLA